MGEEERRRPEPSMAESQLVELQNMRVLLEEANLLARNLAYHRRAKLEAKLELVLYDTDRQIEDIRADGDRAFAPRKGSEPRKTPADSLFGGPYTEPPIACRACRESSKRSLFAFLSFRTMS